MAAAAIPALILAAGKSTRMGRPKALLPISHHTSVDHADTFLSRLVDTFHQAGVADVVVVVGHDAAAIGDAIARLRIDARIVVNENYDRGQLTSLLAGLRFVDRVGIDAALMTPVDVPLVAASTVRAVVQRYRQTGAAIVRPVNGARHGHPVLIDRTLFGALRALQENGAEEPSIGAKAIVRAHASAAGDVDVADEGAFADVDTRDQYEALLRRLKGESSTGV